ncbi:MAG: type II toxin-antitoxin system HicB family antitoxin [Prolixibacteraceae bacterium]|nr:type II toxin-antitoxin system HicB family antitoxin [Prolixibacteraceae bacterium]
MVIEAIELYIESLKEHGEPIPDESSTLEYSLTQITLMAILRQAGIDKSSII